MKNWFNRYLVFFAVVGMILVEIAVGCGPVRISKQYHKFNRIYVGWVDLGEQDWVKFGYETKSEWIDEIKAQNVNLQTYTKKDMKMLHVIGADSKTSAIPWSPDTLVILFSHVSLIANQLQCEMSFYDGGTRKLLKRMDVQPWPFSFNSSSDSSNMSLSGELSNSMYNMAQDIKTYLTMEQ